MTLGGAQGTMRACSAQLRKRNGRAQATTEVLTRIVTGRQARASHTSQAEELTVTLKDLVQAAEAQNPQTHGQSGLTVSSGREAVHMAD